MSIQDNKYEVYVPEYHSIDYANKKYIECMLEQSDFNLASSIHNADFIFILDEYKDTYDAIFSHEYAEVNYIEIAESLYDLCKLRDDYELKEIK